jgi:hypothetical protein
METHEYILTEKELNCLRTEDNWVALQVSVNSGDLLEQFNDY